MWKIKHENTAWHLSAEDEDFDIPDLDEIKGASYDAFLMNQRITSETFRFRFLDYNRSWLVNQLPSMLTPRTLKRARPSLINQFSRTLNSLNHDISSDSEDDSPKFGRVAISSASRKLIRLWLEKARKQVTSFLVLPLNALEDERHPPSEGRTAGFLKSKRLTAFGNSFEYANWTRVGF